MLLTGTPQVPVFGGIMAIDAIPHTRHGGGKGRILGE